MSNLLKVTVTVSIFCFFRPERLEKGERTIRKNLSTMRERLGTERERYKNERITVINAKISLKNIHLSRIFVLHVYIFFIYFES